MTLAALRSRVIHTLRLAGLGDEADFLLGAALGCTRATLLAHPERIASSAEVARVLDWSARRARGEPLAYLTREREFWSLSFLVSPAVLVPRPETEGLVERALELGDALGDRPGNADRAVRVLDLGTGSGCIAISIAHERPGWQVCATDASNAALAIARENARRLVESRVEFREGSWYDPLAGERFDLIVGNPPYIGEDEPEMAGTGLSHEPRGALTPGADGLAALRAIVEGAPQHLNPGGCIALEHGHAQGEAVRALLVARGFTRVRCAPDLAGHDRVASGHWSDDGRHTMTIRFKTNHGEFDVELNEKDAPLSSRNFAEYANAGFFDGTIFHRVIPGFMIQGGGMKPNLSEPQTLSPIKNESDNGLKNARGTIAMARTNAPNSATAQFFINVKDNAGLNGAPGRPGYAVFGKVVEGMDVVDKIVAVRTTTKTAPDGNDHDDVPVEAVIIKSARRKAAK